MAIENEPFEDVSPLENGHFNCHVSSPKGTWRLDLIWWYRIDKCETILFQPFLMELVAQSNNAMIPWYKQQQITSENQRCCHVASWVGTSGSPHQVGHLEDSPPVAPYPRLLGVVLATMLPERTSNGPVDQFETSGWNSRNETDHSRILVHSNQIIIFHPHI